MDRHRAALTGAAFALPVAFLAVFFGVPAATLVATGLREGGSWDLGEVGDVLGSSSTRRVAWFTLWQAAASTLATVVIALPAAWLIGRISMRGRALFSAVLVVPFVLPTVVVGTAFLTVLGPAGPVASVASWFGAELDLRQTATAVILAHVFFNYAVVARTVGAAWAAVDPSVEEAARTMGASRWQAFRTVTLPILTPGFLSVAMFLFINMVQTFDLPLVLGSSAGVHVLRRTRAPADRLVVGLNPSHSL